MAFLTKALTMTVLAGAALMVANGSLHFTKQNATPAAALSRAPASGSSTVPVPLAAHPSKPAGTSPVDLASGVVLQLAATAGYVADQKVLAADRAVGELSLLGVPAQTSATAVVADTSHREPGYTGRLSSAAPTASGVPVASLVASWSRSIFAGPQPALLVELSGAVHAIDVYRPRLNNDVLRFDFYVTGADEIPAKLQVLADGQHPVVSGPLPAQWADATLYLMLPSVRVEGSCILMPGASCDGLTMFGVSLQGVGMAGSTFIGTALDQASLRSGSFANANFARASLFRADLTEANMSHIVTTPATGMAQLDAQRANFTRALLPGVEMSRSDLAGATFTGADLAGANLAYSRAAGATFAGATIAGTTFSRADLRDVSFHGAILDGADLAYADLRGADLRGASAVGANFYGALTDGMLTDGLRVVGAKCPSGQTVTHTTCAWSK